MQHRRQIFFLNRKVNATMERNNRRADATCNIEEKSVVAQQVSRSNANETVLYKVQPKTNGEEIEGEIEGKQKVTQKRYRMNIEESNTFLN